MCSLSYLCQGVLSSTTALPRAGVALVCALRRRVRGLMGRRSPDASRDDPCCRARHPTDRKRTASLDAKPATAGEAHQNRDLIHGAKQRRDSDLTAQCSGSSTTPCRQLAWQLRNCGAVQRPTVAALGEGLFLASSRHARAREARDCTCRRRRREHSKRDPRKRAKSSLRRNAGLKTPTIPRPRR